jgi:hypothetical protein
LSSNKILISFIIVNHNTGSILKQCIDSVYEYEKDIDFEIIIVDQNSRDDSGKIINELAASKRNIKKIFLDEVKSFSYANNRGYEISYGNYILIMNPDIIFTQSLLHNLTGILDQPDVGAVCPLLIGKDGIFQNNYFQRYPTVIQFILFYSFMAKTFLKSARLINRYLENRDINPYANRVEFIEQIPCAFFLTKRSVFEQAGKMDESYMLFFEDVDLSYQVHKNYKLAINTSLRVTHLGGVSFKNEDNWWVYGRFILSMNNFFEKNYSRFTAFILKVISVKNSLLVICIEYTKKIFNKSDNYRLKKHKYYLKEFKKYYL